MRPKPSTGPVERRRRALLQASDQLLDQVEELRLRDYLSVPAQVRSAIRDLQVSAGRGEAAAAPANLRAAHQLVLAIQHRLMAANPNNVTPRVHPGAFVDPSAQVIGDVTIEEGASVWPLTVLRGDQDNYVTLGRNSNVQDNSVLHVTPEFPCIVGAGVTIGHRCVVHACTIMDNVRIGIVSDIHCNAAGLLEALRLMGDVDEVFCLGDSIWEYRFSNGVAQILKEAATGWTVTP